MTIYLCPCGVSSTGDNRPCFSCGADEWKLVSGKYTASKGLTLSPKFREELSDMDQERMGNK